MTGQLDRSESLTIRNGQVGSVRHEERDHGGTAVQNCQVKRRVSCASPLPSSTTCVVLRVNAHALAQQLQRRLLEVALAFRTRQQLEKRASVLAARLDVVAAANEVEKAACRGRQERKEESGWNAGDAPCGKGGSLALKEPMRWNATQPSLQRRRIWSEARAQERRQSRESRLRMEPQTREYASRLLLE